MYQHTGIKMIAINNFNESDFSGVYIIKIGIYFSLIFYLTIEIGILCFFYKI